MAILTSALACRQIAAAAATFDDSSAPGWSMRSVRLALAIKSSLTPGPSCPGAGAVRGTQDKVDTLSWAPGTRRLQGPWRSAARFETAQAPAFRHEQRVQATGRQPHRAPVGGPFHYERHRPEQTTLYRLVQQHAATFFAFAQTEAAVGAALPQNAQGRVRRLPRMRHPRARLPATALRRLRPRQAGGVQLQAARLLATTAQACDLVAQQKDSQALTGS